MWARKARAGLEEREPPRSNISNGYSCARCRRFDHAAGQEWLNRTTHQFDKGESERMNLDIVRLVARAHSNVTMPDLASFGACLERDALVPSTYPGCDKFVERKEWKP
jgi:hypothetical protein